jgi:hypothetical protein
VSGGWSLSKNGAPLASQSTISHLEKAPRKTEAARLTAALVDKAARRQGRVPAARTATSRATFWR